MDNEQIPTDTPTMQLRAIGDYHVTSMNIPIGATLEVDGVEII